MNTRTLLLAAGSILGMAASAAGQASSVTLQWDPSPDSSQAGYIVFVGDTSGSYQEQYDAGLRTSFVYTKALAGQTYFFSVAAYSTARQVGPRSEEVLFLAGGAIATGVAASALGLQTDLEDARGTSAVMGRSTTSGRSAASGSTCLGSGGCYRVDPVANLAGEASALTRASDTRVFFIEGGKRVRVIEDGSLIPDPALVADTSSTFSGLALDPGFAQSGYVYVGVIAESGDGGRQLDIVRYRQVANALGEGAAIVVGMPLSATGDASFTVDASRRLYVAMPATPASAGRTTRYAGMVLRFESDGASVREDGADAPVFSPGYAEPTAMAWTSAENALWLAGTGADGARALARLSLYRATAVPAASVGASITGVPPALVLVDEAGGVFRIVTTPGGMIATPWIAPNEMGDRIVAAVSAGLDNDIYLATSGADSSSQIVRLRRQ